MYQYAEITFLIALEEIAQLIFHFQLEQALLNQKQQQLEADLAKKERDRLEEMRKREQNRIMEVYNIKIVACLTHISQWTIPLLSVQFSWDGGARWRNGRASDSESRGPGFDPHCWHRFALIP